MIVNCILLDATGTTIVSAGWDAVVNFWVKTGAAVPGSNPASPTMILIENLRVDREAETPEAKKRSKNCWLQNY